MMTFVNPSQFANERQARHPQIPQYHGPRPPKRRRIRNLVRRILGRGGKSDQ